MKRILVTVVLGMLYTGQNVAGGFRIPESSVEGIALSNTLVANPVLTDAFTYNYATMGFHEGITFSIAGLGISTDSGVTLSAPNTIQHVNNKSDNALLPSLYFMQQINNTWSWGVQAGIPFGLETVWPADTFSHFYAVDAALNTGGSIAGLHPTDSDLQLFNISPSIGLKLNEQLSLALGVDYYRIKSVEVNAVGSSLKGEGDDLGWNVAMMYRAADWTFGASFHSESKIDIDGKLSIVGVGVIAGSSELTLPSRFQIGAHYQYSERLALEIDIERIGWHVRDKTTVLAESGAILSQTTNDWDDTTNIRLGATWELNPKTMLLFGAGFSETPISEKHFDATIAGNDTYMLSFGLTRQLSKGWVVKAGYQYAWAKDRRVTGRDYIAQVAGSGGANVDPNGTDVYNGKYKGDAHMLGIGVSKTF